MFESDVNSDSGKTGAHSSVSRFAFESDVNYDSGKTGSGTSQSP